MRGAVKSGGGKESLVHTDSCMGGFSWHSKKPLYSCKCSRYFYVITHQCMHCSLPVQMAEATRTDDDDAKMLGRVLWNPLDMQDYALSQSK